MTLKERITELPGDEWWKSHSEDVYFEAAESLVAHGFSEDEAVELLSGLYFAAADCYGG